MKAQKVVKRAVKRSRTVPLKERATFKVAEAASYAGCGESSIREGVAEGRIPHIRFGRNILIPKEPFRLWLESGGKTQGGQAA